MQTEKITHILTHGNGVPQAFVDKAIERRDQLTADAEKAAGKKRAALTESRDALNIAIEAASAEKPADKPTQKPAPKTAPSEKKQAGDAEG